MNDRNHETLPVKLAHLLLEQSNRATQNILDVSLQDIAEKVGAYRETVGALLVDFHKRQWIAARHGELTILDAAPLLLLAGFAKDGLTSDSSLSRESTLERETYEPRK